MDIISRIFHKTNIKETIFSKEFSSYDSSVEELENLLNRISNRAKKSLIEKDIMLLKIGKEGEKRIAFELRNSFLPMIILHDIRVEVDDKTAQIDYIIIFNTFICVIETKLLNGDISINSEGEFIRKYFNKKEGMYSPIEQNNRHINILKKLFTDNKIARGLPIKSLVVLTNSKTVIDKKYAKKTMKEQIVKVDSLNSVLRELIKKNENNDYIKTSKRMLNISDFLISVDKKSTIDYTKKYNLQEGDFKNIELLKNDIEECDFNTNIIFQNNNIDKLIENKLKIYRLDISRKENKPAYVIFTNKILEELVLEKPKNTEELLKISGFGDMKVLKYGSDILKIISTYHK